MFVFGERRFVMPKDASPLPEGMSPEVAVHMVSTFEDVINKAIDMAAVISMESEMEGDGSLFVNEEGFTAFTVGALLGVTALLETLSKHGAISPEAFQRYVDTLSANQ